MIENVLEWFAGATTVLNEAVVQLLAARAA